MRPALRRNFIFPPAAAFPHRVFPEVPRCMRSLFRFVLVCFFALPFYAYATVFATIHGVVHDPQHRPVAGAHVLLKAAASQFSLHTDTDMTGEFDLPEAPLGVYQLEVASAGFSTSAETIQLATGTNPVLHN